MADSAVEPALEYLETRLGASVDADLAAVTVAWGPPIDDSRPAEGVYVGFGLEGESGDSNRNWGPIGERKLDEDLELHVAVEVTQTDGTNLKPAYTRSRLIAEAVEREIRADITLGDILMKGASITRTRGRYFRTAEARGHRVFLTLAGTARI